MASKPTRLSLRTDKLDVTCETGKVSYATRDRALDGAERAMEAGRVDPGCHLTPYLCGDCGDWHVRNRRIVHVPSPNLAKHDHTNPHSRRIP